MTAREYINLEQRADAVPAGQWVYAEAPARVDLAGGWSDTPPITYEHGGAVTNFGILIDGCRPIGAKIRRIPRARLELATEGLGGQVRAGQDDCIYSESGLFITMKIQSRDYDHNEIGCEYGLESFLVGKVPRGQVRRRLRSV